MIIKLNLNKILKIINTQKPHVRTNHVELGHMTCSIPKTVRCMCHANTLTPAKHVANWCTILDHHLFFVFFFRFWEILQVTASRYLTTFSPYFLTFLLDFPKGIFPLKAKGARPPLPTLLSTVVSVENMTNTSLLVPLLKGKSLQRDGKIVPTWSKWGVGNAQLRWRKMDLHGIPIFAFSFNIRLTWPNSLRCED